MDTTIRQGYRETGRSTRAAAAGFREAPVVPGGRTKDAKSIGPFLVVDE
jgi:hypothetical protein